MSATDELRRLLDERGMEYYYPHNYGGMVKWSDGVLTYHAANAFPCNDPTMTRLVMHVTYPTPEQAIAATLGRGTCRDVGKPAVFKCSECGWYSPVFTFGKEMPQFCPSCGRRVVHDGS